MPRLASALLLLFAPAAAFSQTYQAPALAMRQLSKADPGFDQAIEAAQTRGGLVAVREFLIDQATSGKLLAQIFLGEQYLPEECVDARIAAATGQTGATECTASTKSGENELGLKPSFEEAFFWLKKASAQGSGEATEILAQQTERMFEAHMPTTATRDDVARLHALARKQGFDDQWITVTCYPVDRKNTSPLHLHGKRGSGDLPDSALAAARKVMPQGELGDYQGGSASSTLLLHPEGPYAQLWILIDHPIAQDVAIPMPLRTGVVAVQKGMDFIRIPADAPYNSRFIALHRNKDGSIETRITETNGSEHTTECVDFPAGTTSHR